MDRDRVPMTAHDFVSQQLDQRLHAVEEAFDADAICIVGPLVEGIDDEIRLLVEEVTSRNRDAPTEDGDASRDRLVVLITTTGGYIEVVSRIVDTLRHHYRHVSIVIPNYAYSAGTVLAMSGDEIWMDYYSRLGPIDPQVENAETGRQVPANGYLMRYDDLIESARKGTITEAETAILINSFNQAELYAFYQQRALSIDLLKEWLVKYKFKDWTRTEHQGIEVTDDIRANRAEEVAKMLGDSNEWHSHARGISRDQLIEKVKLKIDDLDEDADKLRAVKEYDRLLSSYKGNLGASGILHIVGTFWPA